MLSLGCSSGDDAVSVAGVLLALLRRPTRPTTAIGRRVACLFEMAIKLSFLKVWLLRLFASFLRLSNLLAESFHLTIGCL